jgi:hypothetical protein
MAFHSDKADCHEIHDRPQPTWFQKHGQTDFAPHAGGTTQLRYDSGVVACGSVQLDGTLANDAGGPEVIVGHVVNYGVDCAPPAVPQPPATPTPPVPPVTPPLPPVPPPVCPGGEAAIVLRYPAHSERNVVPSADWTSASATFEIAPGCHGIGVSLVSYQRTTVNKFPQRFVAGVFERLDEGVHTLTVRTEPCSMQADLRVEGFVQGEDLTSENEAADYGPRTLDWIYTDGACR